MNWEDMQIGPFYTEDPVQEEIFRKEIQTRVCYLCAQPFYEGQKLDKLRISIKYDLIIHSECQYLKNGSIP